MYANGSSPPIVSRTRGTSMCTNKGKATRPYEGFFNNCRYNATSITSWRNFGRIWAITYEEFLKFIEVKSCHYCGNTIYWPLPFGKRNAEGRMCKASNLDRVDNAKDYSADNCVVCCWECNRTRRDLLSYQEMVVIGRMRSQHSQQGAGLDRSTVNVVE